jgi:flagellar hook assembly protein FlgD
LRLALPADAEVSIAVYDIQGRKVAGLVSEFMTAGIHDVAWNGTDEKGTSLASGVYFCRVQVNNREALMEKLVKL